MWITWTCALHSFSAASLARLLPGIEINKELSGFFDDPKREHLTGWQSLVWRFLARCKAIAITGYQRNLCGFFSLLPLRG
jgi:hypothetical protein